MYIVLEYCCNKMQLKLFVAKIFILEVKEMETNQTSQTVETQQIIKNKKMMNCKTCGAPMAKSAKKCQSCGAKNPRKKIKKILVLLIIVGIIVGYPAFFIITENPTATITANNGEEFTKKEFASLYHEYILNDKYIEFTEEYLPAQVVIEGKIDRISDTTVGVSGSAPSIHIESGAHNLMKIEIGPYIYKIKYDIWDKAENHEFGKLKVDDKVVAVGIITKNNTLTPENYIRDELPDDLEVIGTEDGIMHKN